jgi:NTP pyrophosphatase (non-canonical NTP hydrolase)
MQFKEIKKFVLKQAKDYEKRYDLKIDKQFAMYKLVEEVGEFAQAVLIHDRKSRPEKFLPKNKSKYEVGLELADVVCMAIVNADRLGIDLEKAIDDKWITRAAYKKK